MQHNAAAAPLQPPSDRGIAAPSFGWTLRPVLGFFLKGLAVGAAIAVPVGPVGVLCVRRTIVEGRPAGLVSGLGAAAGDAVFAFVAAFGLTFVSNWLLGYQQWLTAGGACFLLVLGGRTLIAEAPAGGAARQDPENLLGDFVSTLVLTVANPITILALLSIFAAIGLGGAQATIGDAAMAVLGVFLGSLLWWLALGFGVARFVSALSARDLRWVNRGLGGILLLSGAGLLIALARNHIG
jgi:threonine/homoserine/homoserine lactone efflux protein